jgi:hypothetical protein
MHGSASSHDQVSDWLEQCGLTVEKIVDLPAGTDTSGALTVTLWLARDPRLLIASDTSSSKTGTV